MANWWTQNEKWIVSAGIITVGYSIISKAFTSLWQLPSFVSMPYVQNISLLTVAAGLSIYGAVILFTKY